MKRFKLFIVLLFVMGIGELFAQEKEVTMNPNSVYPVSEDHKLYKMTVWRDIDFREKQNHPFFSKNNEITKIIIDAVNDGRLVPYKSDSLVHRMTKEDFIAAISYKTGADESNFGNSGSSNWGGASSGSGGWGSSSTTGTGAAAQPAQPAAPATAELFPSQLYLMEMKEEVYFDDIRSRMYHDIQALTIIKPADLGAELNPTQLNIPVASFKYKDLEKLFRSMPGQAIWYNAQNTAQNRNLADAFLLRLFSSRIVKVSNPDDERIDQIYDNPKLALYMSEMEEYKLMEYEHDLWSY